MFLTSVGSDQSYVEALHKIGGLHVKVAEHWRIPAVVLFFLMEFFFATNLLSRKRDMKGDSLAGKKENMKIG